MRNRLWRSCTRTAAAITASVVTLAAGGTLTAAGPASAATSSKLRVIKVTNGEFNVILPNPQVGRRAVAASNVTAAHAFSSFQKLTIQSEGFDIDGRIKGTLKSHNFESLWTVYNLPRSSGWKVWALSFKKDSSQSVLKETFHREQLVNLDIDIHFTVKAASLKGVSTLRIGFETVRLELDGVIKDFTVVNPESGGAKDQDGKEIPVEFDPI
ncbi:hypothetical protein [Actinomadura roseirufa]|uniref:hypothetical protein n=1 Tax=Actinomadura roseirufa TaxID=2094049 RepID=UPI0010412111|nr:hypothetical protein [Actinomadura roseirufa]